MSKGIKHHMKLSGRLKQLLCHRHLSWLIVSICGALTPFTFAPYRLYWLMPILFCILVLTIHRHHDRVLRLAYLWGFFAYLTQNYWVNISLHDVGGLPQSYAIPMTLLFPLYLALYPALCFWILEKLPLSKNARLALILPPLWTICEYLRSTAMTGFSWGVIGYSQIADSPLSGLAPVGGIFLVTLAVASIGTWLAILLITRSVWSRIWSILAILSIIIYSNYLQQIDFTTPDGTQNKIALIQGNVPQDLKFDPEQYSQDIQMYYDKVASLHDVDIVILPESAIPVLRQALPEGLLAQFASTAKRNKFDLATGIVQLNSNYTGYENAVISLAQFNPEDYEQLPYYSKNHLVPFGEYRPLPLLTTPLYNLMNMPFSDLSSGGKQQKPLHLASQRIAFNICYEDSFGDELIHSAKQSSLMANVSNMGWFGSSNAMNIQLQHSQTRAMENGRYMVRATNNGITAVINNKGSVVAMIPRDINQTLIATIYGYTGETPYMKMGGSLPIIGILTIFITMLTITGIVVRRHHYKSKQIKPNKRKKSSK